MLITFRIRHAGHVHTLALGSRSDDAGGSAGAAASGATGQPTDGETATVGELTVAIAAQLGVPKSKQRLFCRGTTAGSLTAMPASTRLFDVLFTEPERRAAATSHSPSLVVSLLLIGDRDASFVAASNPPAGDANGTAGVGRSQQDVAHGESRDSLTFVAHTVDDRIFQCSYAFGPAPINVFVCRTCIENGDAPDPHGICGACVDICHVGHRVEGWGMRRQWRCDCCTFAATAPARNWIGADGAASTTQLARHHCRFLHPAGALVPANAENVYPQMRTTRWCACGMTPEQVETDTGADADTQRHTCVSCGDCYWAGHLSRVSYELLMHATCNCSVTGDPGQIMVHACRTCDRKVCTPCRLRCHAGHRVDGPTFAGDGDDDDANSLDGPDNDDPASGSQRRGGGVTAAVEFQCGCAPDMCLVPTAPAKAFSTAEEVAAFREAALTLVDGLPLVTHLLADATVRFVCEPCRQNRLRFLANDDFVCGPSVCIASLGDASALRQQVLRAADERVARDDAPAPSSISHCAITEASTTAAAESATERSSHGAAIPADLFSQLVCPCDACAALYDRVLPGCRELTPRPLCIPLSTECTHCRRVCGQQEPTWFCVTCELNAASDAKTADSIDSGIMVLCAACHATAARFHDASHEFAEATFDNLWDARGAALLKHGDAETRRWVASSWQAEAKDAFVRSVRGMTHVTTAVPSLKAEGPPAAAAARRSPSGKRARSSEGLLDADADDQPGS